MQNIEKITDKQKQELWTQYDNNTPTRVPLRFNTNERVFLLNQEVNTEGYGFTEALGDPKFQIKSQLGHQLYRHTVLNHYCDEPTELPDVWEVQLNLQNVYVAGYFGAKIECKSDQVPGTSHFLTEDTKHEIFDIDIKHPLENPFIKHWIQFVDDMEKIAKEMTFEGRPIKINKAFGLGTNGPLTNACDIRGTDFLMELVTDEQYADRLLNFMADATICRYHAMAEYFQIPTPKVIWFADDTIAMISVDMYREKILPIHRKIYNGLSNTLGTCTRLMHLCGDATRHFATIAKELNVDTFDTGFPVDFGELRQSLGPDVTIQGGVEVPMIMGSTPNKVYQRAKEILQSGIMRGGRFIMTEGNNLPPCAPLENLEAMYAACQEFGRYDTA